MNEVSTSRKRLSGWRLTWIVVSLLLAVGCGYFFVRWRQTVIRQELTPAAKTTKLLQALRQEIALPSEQPTLATVQDRTKLGDSNLIAEARNGDQLIIYATAKRVILYRPSSQQVIDMFHVTPATTAPAGSAGATH